MNAHTGATIFNVSLVVLIILSIYFTGTLWGIFALFFVATSSTDTVGKK
jgi:hypothetical protein